MGSSNINIQRLIMKILLQIDDILTIIIHQLDLEYVPLTLTCRSICRYICNGNIDHVLNQIINKYFIKPYVKIDAYRPPYEFICSALKSDTKLKPLLTKCREYLTPIPPILVEFFLRKYGLSSDVYTNSNFNIVVVQTIQKLHTRDICQLEELSFIINMDMMEDNCSMHVYDLIYRNESMYEAYENIPRQRYISYQAGIHLECERNHPIITYRRVSRTEIETFNDVLNIINPIAIDSDFHLIVLELNNPHQWIYQYRFEYREQEKIIKYFC